ncbi:hypothetical protein LTR15_011831 [Elasticomyces elasticus]|nr:hypothetical protein LTR15_011831 [Elasticomyces elasticus]
MAQYPPIFTPSHQVWVNYPVKPETHTPQHNIIILPIHDSHNRYEPRPLMTDNKVLKHTFLDEEDAAMFCITKAIAINTQDLEADELALRALLRSNSREAYSHTRLLEDMAAWKKYHGSSTLDLYTYVEDDKPVVRLHIHFTSELRLNDPPRVTTSINYDMELTDFESIGSTEFWYLNALDVLHRRSDRAYQHVKLQIEREGLTDVATGWKSPRETDILQKFPSITDTDDLEDCGICGEPLAEGDPVGLLCHSTHSLCRHCLNYLVISSGMETVKCPWDRSLLYTAADCAALKWGTNGKAYNRNEGINHLFDDYETFIRANNDLDCRDHANQSEPMTINAAVLVQILDVLIDGALLEPATSTPFHLQPVRSTEMPRICALIKLIFVKYAGRTHYTHVHYMATLFLVVQKLKQEYENTPEVFKTMTSGEQECMKSKVECECFWRDFRPGVLNFVARLIDKTLEFAKRRQCEGTSCVGFHYHGEKMYYNNN